MSHDDPSASRPLLAGGGVEIDPGSEKESVDSSLHRLAELLEPATSAERILLRPKAGDVFAQRFRIERLAGRGGMGAVYAATDLLVGARVAIKVTTPSLHASDDRFREEARVLAQLSHPAIVRYITEGWTKEGAAYLAMEWLEGEDLAARLAEKDIAVEDSLELVHRVAEGLAVAHANGIVHRDIKPSNVFLVGKEPRKAKLLDFGIARQGTRNRVITGTGAVLGTVGYMAPEQAQGKSIVDARVDIFSLGCVLFECLVGRPAFHSKYDVAVLAKILLEDAPRVRELRPDIPAVLDDLVARMLAKDPALRPPHASALLVELDRMNAAGVHVALPPSVGKHSLTRVERRFVTVMLLEYKIAAMTTGTLPHTLDSDEGAKVHAVVRRFGSEIVHLGAGIMLITPTGHAGASDRATQAASCALHLAATLSVKSIALATGRAETTGGVPVGPVIDRAVNLLMTPPSVANGTRETILMDEVTAGLLDTRFETRREGSTHFLVGERVDSEWPRTLLGKHTPCVGRNKELAILQAVAGECFSDSTAHVVLVTGPPGIGKSRLRREFLMSIRQDHDVNVLFARADQMGAGSSLMLARQLVRNAIRVNDGDPAAIQYAAIVRYLAPHFSGADLLRVSDFLAELVEAPTPNEPSPQLRAARNDVRIMGEWMHRTFEEWLGVASSSRPTVLVLEDLHWGDLPSVNYIEHGLRKLVERPLMVLALARPEVHDVFPKLRAGVLTQEILLAGLTRRPAERLVRVALGDGVSDVAVSRIVEQADGNAFYIEELIRRVAEEGSRDLPDTVLAMVAARLHALEPEARLVLRAASIFGDACWEGGIMALVSGLGPEVDVGAWLHLLVERELLTPERTGKFQGENGYAFRHSLVRETAYAMLTDADREQGHVLAAEWLVRMGEKDALVLSDHYERGQKLDSALPWLLRAAEVALHGANHDIAVEIAERALKAVSGESRGVFLEIQQLALTFRGDWSRAFEVAAEAMSLLPAGTTRWFRSAGSAMVAAIYLGKPETTLRVLQTSGQVPLPEPTGPFGFAMHMLIAALLHAGARETALSLLEKLEASAKSQTDFDPVFAGWLRTARCTAQLFLHDEVAPAVANARAALKCFDEVADFVGWAVAALYLGIAYIEAGFTEAARRCLDDVIAKSDRLLLPTGDFARYYLARVEALLGRTEPAVSLLGAPPGIADGARGFVAEAHLRAGNLDLAEKEARHIETSASVYARVTGLSVLARLALQQGRVEEALVLLERAIVEQDRGSAVPFWRSILLLSRFEALEAAGQTEAAREALRGAYDRVLRIASGFDERRMPELTDSYSTALEANTRTLALGRTWFGISGSA